MEFYYNRSRQCEGEIMKQIVKPKIMRNICMNAHPIGCENHVHTQIDYVKEQGTLEGGPKSALIIGGSAGYGLATRISAAYGYGAKTLNVAFEMPANEEKKRPASVGWYNTLAFETQAKKDGLWAKSIFGDAFSNEIKTQAINQIKNELGQVDMVIYSLASGKRTDPNTGETYTSVLKPFDKPFTGRTIDVVSGQMTEVTLEMGTEEEKNNTIKVMGGEDWKMWIDALMEAGVLAENSITLAYSYVGPELTAPLYRLGTIGKAKEDLERTAHEIDLQMQKEGLGRAFVSVNKGLVTRASMVIPVVPIYFAILYKVMKDKGLHEVCIHQMHRMCKEKIYNGKGVKTDNEQRIRMDDWEMRDDVQSEISALWDKVTEDNLRDITDFDGFQKEFYQIHGFEWDGIDYSQEVEI